MKKSLTIASLVLFAVVVGIVATTYSKYKSWGIGAIPVSVASLRINDNRATTLNVNLDDMVPGDIREYEFNIVNHDGNIINEASLDYTITISKSTNIPVTLTLLKNEIDCLNNLVCTGVLGIVNQQTDNYKLVINWNIDDNSYEYSGLTDYLDIMIEATQKMN